MKLTLTRHGGLAGLAKPQLDIDSSVLSYEDQQNLHQLMEDARFFELPAELLGSDLSRDEFTWELAIDDGARSKSIAFRHQAATEPLRKLVQAIRSTGRGPS